MTPESQKPPSTSMRKTKRYKGVIIPMVTPATENGQADEKATIRIIDSFVEAGVEPFIFGTTGEAASISTEEKIRLASAICPQFVGRTTIYMGISSNSFADTVDMCSRFADLGADVAVANLPSYYTLGTSQMLGYFEKLADAISLPLVIYNIPSTTRMSIPLEVVETLSHHPGIVGLKDSERDEERLKAAISQYKDRDDFSHFIGWAAESKKALIWGSDGLVPSAGNLVPGMYRDLYDAALRGDEDTAQRLQDEVNEVSKIFQENRNLGDSLAALKVLLNEAGLCGTDMFPPLSPIDVKDQEVLRKRVTTYLKN